MEVRYIFLLPPVLEEILFSTSLIRSIIKSLDYAEVITAVPKQFHWVLENNPYISSQILYEKSPSKNLREFKDVEADYIVDLTGGKGTSWFKNRIRVMDFTMPYKKLKHYQNLVSKPEAFENFRGVGFDLLSAFDLEDDGQGMDYFYGHNKTFVENALPESFLENYAVLDLPAEMPEGIDFSDPLSELISRIERPLVLCGSEQWRLTGEKIMRNTGCTILSTCGDFSEQEQVFIRSDAKVLLNIEEGKEIWSMVFDKPHFFIEIDKTPDSWKGQVESIRNYLKQK